MINSSNHLLDYEYKNTTEEFDPLMDEFDAAELGKCKEIIRDEAYMPCNKSRDWIRCFILTCSQPDSYRLYLENSKNRFLLSAKRFSPELTLISNHEDFPMIEMKPKKGFIGRVEQQSDSSYLVCLNRCHLCDGKLGRFTCGRATDEREVVAKVTHSFRRLNKPADIDFRLIHVTLPVVSETGMRRVWCPRSFEIAFPKQIGNSFDMSDAISRFTSMGVRYVNQLPEWSDEFKTLVLKFQGNRVLTASSKNFLIYAEKYSTLFTNDNKRKERLQVVVDRNGDSVVNAPLSSPIVTRSRSSSASGRPRSARKQSLSGEDFEAVNGSSVKVTSTDSPPNQNMEDSSSLSLSGHRSIKGRKRIIKDATDVAVLQFGKSSSSRYVLDFKYPLSPIQAFGIALSAFSFQDSYDNNHKFKPQKR